MGKQSKLAGRGLVGLFVFLSLGIILVSLPATGHAASTGTSFDHAVIIAMENQNYADILGDGTSAGCPSGAAPFLCSMLPYSATIPNYHSYCVRSTDPACAAAGTLSNPPCSAACYTAVTSGATYGASDGLGTGSISATNIFDSLSSAGLSWTEFCESGCPRGPDHSPCLQYADTANSPDCVTLSGALIGNSQVLTTTSNYVWITPTDNHNMHDNSISSGDSWLKSFLVGSGSLTSPASGSLLSTSLFTNPSFHTLLWIWWDEYDPSPNIEYGPRISQGSISASNSWDEYSQLRMIENNWGLSTLTNDAQAPLLSDIFGTANSPLLSVSLNISPSSPGIGTSVAFTGSATGGTAPYAYSWNFGDGATANGPSVTHSYASAGTYTVMVNTTDGTGLTTTKTKQVTVGQTLPPSQYPGISSILSFLLIGTILGGAAGATLYLARYHAHNKQLQSMVENTSAATPREGYGSKD